MPIQLINFIQFMRCCISTKMLFAKTFKETHLYHFNLSFAGLQSCMCFVEKN